MKFHNYILRSVSNVQQKVRNNSISTYPWLLKITSIDFNILYKNVFYNNKYEAVPMISIDNRVAIIVNEIIVKTVFVYFTLTMAKRVRDDFYEQSKTGLK